MTKIYFQIFDKLSKRKIMKIMPTFLKFRLVINYFAIK